MEEWLDDHSYMPSSLRDFHHQKDLFRAIDEATQAPDNPLFPRINWMHAQVYVIDVFLRYMARRGYTLQRTRVRTDFRDLEEDVACARRLRTSQPFPHLTNPNNDTERGE